MAKQKKTATQTTESAVRNAKPKAASAQTKSPAQAVTAAKTKPAASSAGKAASVADSEPVAQEVKSAKISTRATSAAALRGKPKAARKGDEARTPAEKAASPAPVKSKSKSGKTSRASRPIAFTLDEALEIAKAKPKTAPAAAKPAPAETPEPPRPAAKKEVLEDVKQEARVLGAASIADILGYSPSSGPKKPEDDEEIPPKFQKYYKLLLELRDHVVSGLDLHTKDTLKRSSKDDSGDLSSYSQHMADAGTDTFDRDFALSLVSSEQDALYEIEDAIKRIRNGTYGTCEITGKPIKKERLLAVPFTRFSVEGQAEYERTNRKTTQRGGVFSDEEGGVPFMEDDSDE